MARLIDHAQKQAEGLPLRLDDIEGQEVTVNKVRWNSGNFGPYCVMEVINAAGEIIDVMTSAMLVLDALEHAEQAEALPAEAMFTRRGRTWIMA